MDFKGAGEVGTVFNGLAFLLVGPAFPPTPKELKGPPCLLPMTCVTCLSGGPNLVRFPGTSRAVARAFLRLLGVRGVDGLRAQPTKALLKAQ
jgi:hypothetical protein